MVHGIADEVIEQPLHGNPSQRERRNGLQTKPDLLHRVVVWRDNFVDQLNQIDFLDLFITPIPDKCQELIEDGVHVFDVAHHAFHELVVGRHQLQ